MRRRQPEAGVRRVTLVRAELEVAGPPGARPEPLDLLLHRTGRALAWWGPHREVRGGLLCEDGPLLALAGLVAVADQPGSTSLWLASRRGDHLQLWSFDGQRLRPFRSVRASGIHLGSHWMLGWRGAETFAFDLETGDPVPLPLGAREARARPWPQEAAASWCAGKSLVQQRGRTSPQAVGVASEPLLGLHAGPHGAALAWGRKERWVHGPGGGLVPLKVEGSSATACAFSPDGEQALVQTSHGVTLVDLRSGEPLDDRPEGVVAGWRCWEDAQGRRHRWLGREDEAPARPLRAAPLPHLPPEVQALGLPLDGAASAPDGGWRCWQEGGLDVELKAGSSTRG